MSDSNPGPRALPAKPSLAQLKKQARELLNHVREGRSDARAQVLQQHPRFADPSRFDPAGFSLSDAQLVIAREYGFLSWPKLKTHLTRLATVDAATISDGGSDALRVLPVIPIRDAVLFPEAQLVLEVGRPRSLAALREVAFGEQRLFCVMQRDPSQEMPDRSQVHDVGTIARVEIVGTPAESRAKVLLRGLTRARLIQWLDAEEPVRAQIAPLSDPPQSEPERLGAVLRLHSALERYARATDHLSLPEIERLAHDQNLRGLIGLAAGRCDPRARQAWLEQQDRKVVIDEVCGALQSLTGQAARSRAADEFPVAARRADAEAELTVLFSNAHPHLRGRRFALHSPATSLGRDDTADVVIPGDAVSRRHASIERDEDGRFVLVDSGSTNGTFVAGHAEPVTRHVLSDGDRFTLGDCILSFLQAPELEAKYQAALDRMTELDALTYLLNRSAFRTRLDRAVLEARGLGQPLSLLIAGVDHLHVHNQTLGKLAGNGLLQHVAHTLRDQLEGTAILGRFGGDQFAAALPRTATSDASERAERLRAALAERELTLVGQRVRLTVSIGSATLHRTLGTDELIEDALAALSQAKHAGRNTVRGPLRAG